MAMQVNVAGAALVKVNTGASGALETLGYTRDGVDIRIEARYLDVPSDDMGGEAGPPTNVQYLGELATIRLELTKFDGTVADKVQHLKGVANPGELGAPGTLLFDDGGNEKAYRLLIQPQGQGAAPALNFPRAFLRDAIEVNKGTRFSRLLMVFEAHKDAAGKLYDNNAT